MDLGRTLTEKELRRYKVSLKSFPAEAVSGALAALRCETIEDFYSQVAYGKLTPAQLMGALLPQDQLRPRKESFLTKAVKRTLGLGDPRVTVKGLDEVMIYLAKCCRPIRGEEIVGYITRGKGISVHRTDCPNVRRLMFDPARRIEVGWAGGDEALYEATLLLDSEDRQGLLARITSTIADEKTNIKNVDARTSEDHQGQISIVLDVKDRAHLERIIERLRRLDGIRRVERVT